MSDESHTAHPRAAIVPRWFMDVLHAVIYADGPDGLLAVRVFAAAIDARSPIDPPLLMGWACGRSQTEIGAVLGVSRHCVCRRMKALRRHFGDRLLRKLHGNKTAAEVLKLFEFRHGKALPNVRHAIERLASLSAMELCVLSAIMRRSVEDETLSCLGISHTWYHAIKARLSAMFHILPSCRKKVSLSACIKRPDLLPFSNCSEKCTFSDNFIVVIVDCAPNIRYLAVLFMRRSHSRAKKAKIPLGGV